MVDFDILDLPILISHKILVTEKLCFFSHCVVPVCKLLEKLNFESETNDDEVCLDEFEANSTRKRRPSNVKHAKLPRPT